MEWVADSYACIDIAEVMLTEVEELIQESIQNDDVIPYLKVKIKNCLENCRSPLDYVANYIFDTYCKSEYTRQELRNLGHTYFPIRNKKHGRHQFDWYIENNYKTLPLKKPKVVEIIESKQKFKNQLWLSHLTKLINENKHRNLTRNHKEHIATINHYAEDKFGNVFSNNVCIGTNGNGIVVDGHSLDHPSAASNPYFKNFTASYYYEYFFTDLELPVIDTLQQILISVKTTISELECALTED